MRRWMFSLGLVSLLASPAALASETPSYAINDSGLTVSHACAAGERVAIAGSGNTVTLSGPCANVAIAGAGNTLTIALADKLAIAGANNTVDVDAAGKIAVTGSGNKVTYKAGLPPAKAPKVSNLGTGNTVSPRP